MMASVSLIDGREQTFLSLQCVRTLLECGTLQARKMALTRSAGTLVLDFLDARTWRNKHLSVKPPHLWHFIMEAQDV